MSINFKNFTLPDFKNNQQDLLLTVTAKANEWIASEGIKVLNVETIEYFGGGGMTTTDQLVRGIRVRFVC